MVFNDTIKVDLFKPLVRTRAVLSSGDDNANSFSASLYRDGEAVSLAGCVVMGYFVLPDGKTVPIKGTASGNTAIVTLSQACYAYGNGTLAVKVGGTDFDTTVRVIDCYTRMLETDTLIDPGDVVPTLDEVLAKIAAVEAATEDAQIAAENANQAAYFLTVKVEDKLRQIAPPIINTATGDGVVFVSDSSENTFDRLSIFGRTTQEGTPSPDNPAELVNIGAKGNIGLMVRGKNLLKNIATSGAWNGISFTVNEDGGVHLTGTATQLFSLVLTETGFIPAGKYLMLPARAGAANRAYVDVIAGGAQVVLAQAAETRPFTIKEGDNAYARIIVPEGETIDAVLYPVIYSASVTDLGFEPFRDGGSMTVNPPDEMHGIPVSSGGNYTDANGQQWICDEIDLARGMYVQRIRMAEAGSFSWTINPTWTESNPSATLAYARITGLKHGTCLSTSFVNRVFTTAPTYWNSGEMATQADGVLYAAIPKLDNPTNEGFAEYLSDRGVWILYQLAEPEETPLTDDIMSTAAALKSLYPNTTIINDEGAGMAAGYVADTKTYIDQRIAALLNA